MPAIRQPIITVLGHVDHGKTSLLDYIRGSTLAMREAGKITQHIGATEVPLKNIIKVCGQLFKQFKLDFSLPGLLFVDTPGHAAFTNLRKRGGSIADLAVLIIDINEGMQPQTKEAIQILKTFKVPFIVAANKIDMISGWKYILGCGINHLEQQSAITKSAFETKLYKILGQLSEQGFDSNIFTEVSDYSKTIAVVPISAKTGEGIPELLTLLAGLSQKFLIKNLEIHEKENAKGTILEIKEEKGLGLTADVIIYDGTLRKNDNIIVGGIDEIFKTKIKALLKPAPLSEIRDKKSRFRQIEEVTAAAGIKMCAPELEKAVAGAPVFSVKNEQDEEKAKEQISKEILDICINTDSAGIILKADTLGSLEAIYGMFSQNNIPIRKASIGDITKRDIMEASSSGETDPLTAFVIGFNVNINSSLQKFAESEGVEIILDKVIYSLQDKYKEKREFIQKKLELESLKGLVWPFKFRILPQYIFRQSNPAIFGVEVIAGKVRPKTNVMNSQGKSSGTIQTIEDQGKKLEELNKNEQAALSVSGLTIGRHADGGDFLFSDLNEEQFRLLKNEAKKFLTSSEIQILKEIAEIKRQDKEMWGI